MKGALVGGLLLALAAHAVAHRLDEYLQAARVLVANNRIDLSLAFTPGVAIVEQLLLVIDRDRDGRVSEGEATAYAQHVLEDIQIGLDERLLNLSVVSTSFPDLQAVKGGTGIIRIKATATIGRLSAGHHILSLTNAHLPAISVYLVNALAPKDRTIKITNQIRDELQKNYRLEFSVSSWLP